jgi:hypothetical protein
MAIDARSFIDKHKDHLTAEEVAEIEDTARGYMSGQDYNRNFNRLKTETAEEKRLAAAEMQAAKDHEANLRDWEREHMFGSTAVAQAPAGDFISKTDFQAALKAQEDRILGQVAPAVGGLYALSTVMPQFYHDYAKAYDKQFPAQKFIDFCNENKIADPALGYKLFTTEDEKERLTKSHAADIVKAGEDAVRAFRTQNHLPETPINRVSVPSPLMRTPRPIAPVAPAQAQAPTVAALNQVAPTLTQPVIPAAMSPEGQQAMQANFTQALEK